MADESQGESNAAIGRRLQERFEAYFIGLIFAVLALSIQTATFGVSIPADILELTAWLLLLVAGMSGLSRAEWLPVLYSHAHERDRRLNIAAEVQTAMLRGNPMVVDETTGKPESAMDYMVAVRDAARTIEVGMLPIEKVQTRKYRLMKWGFAAGVASLAAARAVVPIVSLIERLR